MKLPETARPAEHQPEQARAGAKLHVLLAPRLLDVLVGQLPEPEESKSLKMDYK